MAECYPLGVYSRNGGQRRIGVRVADKIVDLAEAAQRQGLGWAAAAQAETLDPLMAAGPQVWAELREAAAALDGPAYPLGDVTLHLPFVVADYVDFYASEHHAARLGRIFRPGQDPLPPAWNDQPLGYHGRAGTVVVSGMPVRRPSGRYRNADGEAVVGPTRKLDVEVEVGFVVGVGTELGSMLTEEQFADHVFGVVVVNDWSARDIQAFETVPLGPFLGKSFQTSISAWVTPMLALAPALLPDGGYDIDLELAVNGDVVSRPPYRTMRWTPAQMLAHLTSNGAAVRTGDLFASGTVSGPADEQVGSLIEAPGRPFLADGDEVVISATAPDGSSGRLVLGEVRGTVLPAHA
ncbi:MAG TPA: fumarylacetoacetate hydrolase family protein [Mycobacteriales bacterium]|nr:fumarylacetoacetate hydrolase family protein [Mycobacteriales bacterium]